MADKIDELLKNEKWRKKSSLTKRIGHEEAERQKEEEMERVRLVNVGKYRGQGIDANMEAFRTPSWKIPEPSERSRLLGKTGPKPWFDSWPQGGNAWPRRKRREYPSGRHNCGFY